MRGASARRNRRPGEQTMIDVYDNETGKLIGSITEADLKVLVDALEEESETDQDYYITSETIDLLGDGRGHRIPCSVHHRSLRFATSLPSTNCPAGRSVVSSR